MKKIIFTLLITLFVISNIVAQSYSYSYQIKTKITGALFFDEDLFSLETSEYLIEKMDLLNKLESANDVEKAEILFNKMTSLIDGIMGKEILRADLKNIQESDSRDFFTDEQVAIKKTLTLLDSTNNLGIDDKIITESLLLADNVKSNLPNRYLDFYKEQLVDMQKESDSKKSAELDSYTKEIESLVASKRYKEADEIYKATIIIDKQYGEYLKYRVKSGDNLVKIASRYYKKGMTWHLLYDLNKNVLPDPDNPNYITIGLLLTIPSWGIKDEN